MDIDGDGLIDIPFVDGDDKSKIDFDKDNKGDLGLVDENNDGTPDGVDIDGDGKTDIPLNPSLVDPDGDGVDDIDLDGDGVADITNNGDGTFDLA